MTWNPETIKKNDWFIWEPNNSNSLKVNNPINQLRKCHKQNWKTVEENFAVHVIDKK